MQSVNIKAYAKINLTLDVLGKRADGYHELQTILQSVELCDELRLERIPQPRIVVETNVPELPTDHRNLATAALQALWQAHRLSEGVYLRLTKQIPMAAGLAGGSADAAAALVGLNTLFGLGLMEEELCEWGAKLGSDVPFCIRQGTWLGEGRGEILRRLPDCPDFWVVLAKPPVEVSTAAVYRNLQLDRIVDRPHTQAMCQALEQGDRIGIAAGLCNVLETVTLSQYPIIAKIKAFLRSQGAAGTLMSGSGPTVFGLFEEQGLAVQAAQALRQELGLTEVFVTSTWQPVRVADVVG